MLSLSAASQPVSYTHLGYETVSRVTTRALFALTAGQPPARQGEIPIIVFNPHPFPVTRTVECEFMLADQNWKKEFTLPVVMKDGVPIPSQPEKEASNLNLDWRKRVSLSLIHIWQAEPRCDPARRG